MPTPPAPVWAWASSVYSPSSVWRSTELDQREVAYYFAALALGLLMGIGLEPLSLAIGLSALLLVIMFVVDHSKLMTTLRSQTIIVDRAISDEDELKAYLSTQLGYSIENATIAELDLINDKTVANIRYTVGDSKKTLPATTSELTNAR